MRPPPMLIIVIIIIILIIIILHLIIIIADLWNFLLQIANDLLEVDHEGVHHQIILVPLARHIQLQLRDGLVHRVDRTFKLVLFR